MTIPDSVTNIGDHAFSYCGSLTEVTIPDRVRRIGIAAFLGCGSLTSVTIPNNVTVIGSYAFSGCRSLAKVAIPDSVTIIGAWAFANCFGLTGVYFKGAPPSSFSTAFDSDNDATAYYLPSTKGWGLAYSGRPTALWLPEVQTSDARFAVQSNQFGLNIAWASGQTIVVHAAENLANPIWVPVQTNTLASDSWHFSDPAWINYPARFYRITSP